MLYLICDEIFSPFLSSLLNLRYGGSEFLLSPHPFAMTRRNFLPNKFPFLPSSGVRIDLGDAITIADFSFSLLIWSTVKRKASDVNFCASRREMGELDYAD